MAALKLNKKSLEDMMLEVGVGISEKIQQEAKSRSSNLEFLNNEIGLPFPKPTEFKSSDLLGNSKKWQDFYSKNSADVCNLRLLPKKGSGVPRKRMVGKTLEENLNWFKNECVGHDNYEVFVVPFILTKKWSTIFIVNEQGIFGEIISGNHTQLTQGHRDNEAIEPTAFSFDYSRLILEPEDEGAREHLSYILDKIKVGRTSKQEKLSKKLNVKFFNGYMSGYFETVHSTDDITTWFIDHSVVLGEEYSNYSSSILKDMNSDEITKLLNEQMSQTYWLKSVNQDLSADYHKENMHKPARLKKLCGYLNLAFDEPTIFSANAVLSKEREFSDYLEANAEKLCAIRLTSYDPALPKMRARRITVTEATNWIAEQSFEPGTYEAVFFPYAPKNKWSAVFIVNKHGIHGQVILGDLRVMTKGVYFDGKPMTFSYDFNDWIISPSDIDATSYLEDFFLKFKVTDQQDKSGIVNDLNGVFSGDFLNGYFEVIDSEMFGLWLLDYNQVLGKMYESYKPDIDDQTKDSLLTGMTASEGVVSGSVHIVRQDEIGVVDFKEGDVLVCSMTTPEYLSLMRLCGAIVTDQGGILSHAAIVARELKKPCIVGVGSGTRQLSNGMQVTVDANKGVVYEG